MRIEFTAVHAATLPYRRHVSSNPRSADASHQLSSHPAAQRLLVTDVSNHGTEMEYEAVQPQGRSHLLWRSAPCPDNVTAKSTLALGTPMLSSGLESLWSTTLEFPVLDRAARPASMGRQQFSSRERNRGRPQEQIIFALQYVGILFLRMRGWLLEM